MRTRAEKEARKEAKVQEWIGVFKRAYEMARAYGKAPVKAAVEAAREVDVKIDNDWKAKPQDGMFFIDCKLELKNRFLGTVKEEEKKSPSKRKGEMRHA